MKTSSRRQAERPPWVSKAAPVADELDRDVPRNQTERSEQQWTHVGLSSMGAPIGTGGVRERAVGEGQPGWVCLPPPETSDGKRVGKLNTLIDVTRYYAPCRKRCAAAARGVLAFPEAFERDDDKRTVARGRGARIHERSRNRPRARTRSGSHLAVRSAGHPR